LTFGSLRKAIAKSSYESNEKVELDFPNETQHIVDYILYEFIEKVTISELEAI